VLIGGTISSNPTVAELETLLGTQGSDLEFGNLLLVPIEDSLLYVRPLYVAATSNPVPELERVIVVYEGEVAVSETLRGALIQIFDDAPDTLEDRASDDEETEVPPVGEPVDPPDATPPEEPGDDVPSLLAAAAAAFDEAQAALEDGDLGLYQDKVADAQELVERAQAAAASAGTTTTTSEDTTA
jgi:uncharacterized membrane protein (UPF0182 family)